MFFSRFTFKTSYIKNDRIRYKLSLDALISRPKEIKERVMSDPLNLKKHIREVKDFPIEGINFRDITSLIENPGAFQTTCKELIEVSKNFNASVITSIESRGFIFAGSISFELGLPFILARKPGKLPNKTFKKDFDLEYGSTSIEIQTNTSFKSSDRVVIVDDLVATGGTCAELLTENFNIQKSNILILSVIDLPELGGSDLIAKDGYNIQTLVSF